MLRAVRALCLAILVAVSTGCGSGPINYDYSKEFDPRKHEYIVGPSDSLTVNVWRNGDLSTAALVRPDGTITMPLIGDLAVAGKTPSQIREEITQRLSTYIKDENAPVTVAVTGVNSYRFTVAGNVARPGTFSSQIYVSVAEAIAIAGGPTRFADSEAVIVYRPDSKGKVRQIPINYDVIQTGNRPDMDIYLVRGDTVFVP